MAQDHKILKVSQEAPREWAGPAGTIYYIKVMLDGHSKPVEVGKKKPDALKAGDTVYGDIESTSYPNDKFKAAQKPNASFSGGGASKPAYQPKDEHAIAKAVALKAAVDFHAHGTKKDTNAVLADADLFLTWLESEKKLDTSPDPMDGVHAHNPMNAAEQFVQGAEEPVDLSDIPF